MVPAPGDTPGNLAFTVDDQCGRRALEAAGSAIGCPGAAVEPFGLTGSIEQLSYEMTAAALAQQERALSGLRARAGTIIAAACVAASFLATHASANSAIWTVALGVTFVISVGASVVVLLPATLVFAYNGALILTAADAAGDTDAAHAYRVAVAWMQPDLSRNREIIGRLARWFYLSAGALALQVLLWTISLAR